MAPARRANDLLGLTHASGCEGAAPFVPHNPVTDVPTATVTLSETNGTLVATTHTTAKCAEPQQTPNETEVENPMPRAAEVLAHHMLLQAAAIALTDGAAPGWRGAGAEGIGVGAEGPLDNGEDGAVAVLEQKRAFTAAEVAGQPGHAGTVSESPRRVDGEHITRAEAALHAVQKEGVVAVPVAGLGIPEVVERPRTQGQSGQPTGITTPTGAAQEGLEADSKALREDRGTVAERAAQNVGDTIRAMVADQMEQADTPIVESDFVMTGGLRFVLPYYYDFQMHAKKRMVGQHPVDLFAAEFPVRDRCVPSSCAPCFASRTCPAAARRLTLVWACVTVGMHPCCFASLATTGINAQESRQT
jgi:hypothetical protein